MSKPRRIKHERCTGLCADGTRCGRRCAEGEVLCSKHQPNAPSVGAVAKWDTDDPLVIFKRLMKSRDERVRLNAATEYQKALDKRNGGDCARCALDTKHDRQQTVLFKAITPEERHAMSEAIRAYKEVRYQIFDRLPDLIPDRERGDYLRVRQLQAAQPPDDVSDQDAETAGLVAQADAEEREQRELERQRQQQAADQRATEPHAAGPIPLRDLLPESRWAEAGLFKMESGHTTDSGYFRADGDFKAWSHADGDEVAQKILSGEITLEDAKAMHDSRVNQTNRWGAGPVRPFQEA